MNPIIPIAAILAVLLWVALMYNALVRIRQQVRESWSGIDTELKRRYDLIPNLVETVKGYASHEREVLSSVTEARSRAAASKGDPDSQARDEKALVDSMNRLLAVADIPDSLRENILAKSDGNPFFIEELLGRFADQLDPFGGYVHKVPENISAFVIYIQVENQVSSFQAPGIIHSNLQVQDYFD